MQDLGGNAGTGAGRLRPVVRYGARGMWVGVFVGAFVVVGGAGVAMFVALVSGKSLVWRWLGVDVDVAVDGAFQMAIGVSSVVKVLVVAALAGTFVGAAVAGVKERGDGEGTR